jgi:signal transduction histidine kinase
VRKRPKSTSAFERRNELLRFAVTDNGIGIDPEYHARIFLAFKRLHGRSIAGTGIGLAICQRVVSRYRGKIWVESEAGQGAAFIFTLPADLAATQQEETGQ